MTAATAQRPSQQLKQALLEVAAPRTPQQLGCGRSEALAAMQGDYGTGQAGQRLVEAPGQPAARLAASCCSSKQRWQPAGCQAAAAAGEQPNADRPSCCKLSGVPRSCAAVVVGGAAAAAAAGGCGLPQALACSPAQQPLASVAADAAASCAAGAAAAADSSSRGDLAAQQQPGRCDAPGSSNSSRAAANAGDDAASTSSSSSSDLPAPPASLLAQQVDGRRVSTASSSGGVEPLLQDNPNHYAMFPILYRDVWTMYKQSLASFWTVDEVDLSHDLRDWRKLSANEQRFIKYVLAFFAGSDGIVLENLAVRFMQDIQLPEVRAFYGFQIAMENIHSEMYSLLLETYVEDASERQHLLAAVNEVSVISKKAAWALKWISSSSSFAQRLLAFACVEGIHFSGSFCAIFWLKKRGLMPGLTFSNELISRDEGLHTDFAVLLYSQLRQKLPQAQVHALVDEAVALEQEFICEALQVEVLGMSAGLMGQYIRFVADRLLVSLGYPKLYNDANPFDWMEQISLQGKANFFERRVGEYQKAGVMGGAGGRPTFENFVFTTDEDF